MRSAHIRSYDIESGKAFATDPEREPSPSLRIPTSEDRMATLLNRFWRDEQGEDLIEYGLLAAFAAAVVTVALINDPVGWKPALVTAFTKVRNALNNIV